MSFTDRILTRLNLFLGLVIFGFSASAYCDSSNLKFFKGTYASASGADQIRIVVRNSKTISVSGTLSFPTMVSHFSFSGEVNQTQVNRHLVNQSDWFNRQSDPIWTKSVEVITHEGSWSTVRDVTRLFSKPWYDLSSGDLKKYNEIVYELTLLPNEKLRMIHTDEQRNLRIVRLLKRVK